MPDQLFIHSESPGVIDDVYEADLAYTIDSRYIALYMILHYNDVITSAMASQITSLMIVYSTVYSGTDQIKYQSSASLAFVEGIHWWQVNSPQRGWVTRKMLPFDDVIMDSAHSRKITMTKLRSDCTHERHPIPCTYGQAMGCLSFYEVIRRKMTRIYPWWRHQWKHFPRYWPFVGGIHRSPGNSPHKGQWRGALMFSLICARMNGWVNNCEAGHLRRHRVHFDVTVPRESTVYV